MKRRKWDSKTKAKIVLEVLSGMSVSEICNKYQISQNQYYLWRDKFLSESYRADEIESVLTDWVEYYNENYLHSALGYQSPNKFEETYNKSRKTLLEIA